MHFGVLGPIELSLDTGDVPLGRRKQRALLAVLLAADGATVPLDRLVDLLWNDEPPSRAIVSLQAYVSNLRRLVEPERAARAPATRLVSRPPGYALRVEPGELDAHVFEANVLAARDARRDGRLEAAEGLLDEALASWRGPAYGEFATEPFALAEAGRLEELRRQALEDRMDARLVAGQHESVAVDAEAFVVAHPLRERAWALLMTALYQGGRQADALRAFQRARERLIDELGLEPGPDLRDLEARILSQDPDLRSEPSRRPDPVRAPGRPSGGDDQRDGSLELVGRAAELGVLTETLQRCGEGRGSVVVVSGEAGVGKTALAGAVAATADANGFAVAIGRSPETRDAPALWPWLQILRRLGVQDTAALIDTGRDELAPVARRAWIVARLLDAAASRPTLIVLDDVQWADGPSQHVLRLLADEIDDEPIMVIATRRTPATDDPATVETMAHLARTHSFERLHLSPLDAHDGATLVRRISGAIADDVAAEVNERAGGNPFYMVELARLVSAQGAASVGGVPSNVHDVVRRRLELLPEQAVAVITIAAVIGLRIDPPILAAVAGLDIDVVLDLLELASVVGLVVDDGTTGGHQLAHDLLRAAITDTIPKRRVAHLHAQVAAALIERHGESPAFVHAIARHAVAAVAVTGPGPAIDRVISSGRAAQWALDLDGAAEQFQIAADLVAADPDHDEQDRVRLLMIRSHIGFLAEGRSDEVQAGFDALLGEITGRGGDAEMAAAFGWSSYAGLWGDFVGVARQASFIGEIPDVDPVLRETAVAYLDGLAAVAFDPQHAHDALLASIRPDAYGVGVAIRQGLLALIDVLVGRHDTARERARAAIGAAIVPDDVWTGRATLARPPASGPWVAAWTGCFAGAALALSARDGDEIRHVVGAARSVGGGIRYSDLVFAGCSAVADVLDGDAGAVDRLASTRNALAQADDGLFGVPLGLAELACRRRLALPTDLLSAEIGREIERTGQRSWLDTGLVD